MSDRSKGLGANTANPEQARQEVEAVLASGILTASSRQAKLLEYLFSKLAQGHTADIKEYTIAVELFGKPTTFDQNGDATVRVEAHRLRKKLQKYYESAGRDHEFHITLPAGQYVLQIGRPQRSDTGIRRGLSGGFGRIKQRYLAAAAICLAAVTVLWYVSRPGTWSGMRIAKTAANAQSPASDPEPDAIRFLTGHTGTPYIDPTGRRWEADRYYEGGVVRTLAREVVPRSSRPELFRRVREGTSRYRIPLPHAEYEVRLYITDPDAVGSQESPDRRFRIMAVLANDRELLRSYSLPVEAGFSGDVRSFAHLRPDSDGFLNLTFYSARGPAAVCAIELLPMRDGQPHPVRIIAQPKPFRDIHGRWWFPDDFFYGGALGAYPAVIRGGLDPGIFSGEHIGDSEYFIPVPEGEYAVNLYFGEGWFGAKEPGGGGIRTRLFDVLLNHERVLENFDMLAEAPPGQLITKTFRGVRPNRRGKIHVALVSKKDQASIRAIEVLPAQ